MLFLISIKKASDVMILQPSAYDANLEHILWAKFDQ